MSLDEKTFTDDLAGCTARQLETLAEWEAKLQAKYRIAGKVWDHKAVLPLRDMWN